MNMHRTLNVLRRAALLLLVTATLTQLISPIASGSTPLATGEPNQNPQLPKERDSEIQNPKSDPPGWKMTTADPVSPDEARRILLSQRKAITGPTVLAGLPTSETEATPEIQALARALRNDPKLIFDYVHNHVDYSPIFGSVNGATAALLAGRGNDCDQTSLFIALMRAAGYTANYVVGDVTYDVARLANWVGVEISPTLAANVFANGGIPVTVTFTPPSTYRIQLTRVWAQAVVSSTTYTFDPAMKEYQDIAGVSNLGATIGYSQTTFMAHALAGATATVSYTQNLNEPNVRADLITYTMNLVNYLRTNMPDDSVDQVIGGRQIAQTEMTAYATSLPYAVSVSSQTTYTTLPNAYRHTLRVQHMGIDRTFNTFEIAGQRVSIFYRAGDNAPVLRVDGTPVFTGTATTLGNRYPMTVTVDHPYAAFGGTIPTTSTPLRWTVALPILLHMTLMACRPISSPSAMACSLNTSMMGKRAILSQSGVKASG